MKISALAALPILFVTQALGASCYERWDTLDKAGQSVLGSSILFSWDKIIFANNVSLELALVGPAQIAEMNGQAHPPAKAASLFRILNPSNPTLKTGNRLCGFDPNKPVTYLSIRNIQDQVGENHKLSFFNEDLAPSSESTPCMQVLLGSSSYNVNNAIANSN